METIKGIGLKSIISQAEFSDPSFQIHSILSSDLTAQEIEDSLAVIQGLYQPLTEFLNKYGELAEKLKEKEDELKAQEEEKNTEILPAMLGVVGLLTPFVLGFPSNIIIPFFIFWGIGCLGLWVFLVNSAKEQQKSLLEQKEKLLLPEIKQIKKQINDLPGTKLLKDATFGVSMLSALVVSKRLISLSTILQKMLIIAGDKESTPSNRLLAMENYLYLLKKQETDEQLLDESKRANDLAEERIKAMGDLENAINLQTEYQIWQDRGYELGKVSAASRLYEKK